MRRPTTWTAIFKAEPLLGNVVILIGASPRTRPNPNLPAGFAIVHRVEERWLAYKRVTFPDNRIIVVDDVRLLEAWEFTIPMSEPISSISLVQGSIGVS